MQFQPGIILLREGTDQSQGKPQLISNINACQAICDTVKTTLGPRGMDKLIYESNGVATISNDGATIMRLLDVVHPAARTLVDIARSQDEEVGDGTTTVVLLAGELLRQAKPFVEDGVHPQAIRRGFRQACALALDGLKELQVTLEHGETDEADSAQVRELLKRCAKTSMNSKLVSSYSDFFATMVVDAVMHLDDDLDLDLVGIKKEKGGSVTDSLYVEGVAFKKTFSYAGFEQQPKSFDDAKVLLLNVELELKSERENAELRIDDPTQYQKFVDAEWKIIYDKLDRCIESGAQIVLSRLAIGDLATQYFAQRGVFCAGRVPEADLKRVSKACGGTMQTSVSKLNDSVLGKCGRFEERQIGSERYNVLTGCPEAKSVSIVVRGGGEHFNDEVERSLHDAIMVVRRARKHRAVVAGGGATELQLSKRLRQHSRTIKGKQQLIIAAFAKALEVVPRQIADNAGFDATDILNKLRAKHASNDEHAARFGVDIANEGGICDTYVSFVWEPALVKRNALTAATEAACLLLSVDETVKNKEADSGQIGGGGAGGGMHMM